MLAALVIVTLSSIGATVGLLAEGSPVGCDVGVLAALALVFTFVYLIGLKQSKRR
jgi:hypothetical protein